MTSLAGPTICMSCEHLDRNTFSDPASPALCAAYPQGIPDEIVYGGADHTNPRGDEVDGITHQLVEGFDNVFAVWKSTRKSG